MQKNEAQISGLVFWKSYKIFFFLKIFFAKDFFQLKCTDNIFKTVFGHFSKIIGFPDVSTFEDSAVSKNFLHYNIFSINKTQENPTHRFGDKFLTHHLIKLLQDRIKTLWVGALSVSTSYISSYWSFHNFLKHIHVIHVNNIHFVLISLLIYKAHLFEHTLFI